MGVDNAIIYFSMITIIKNHAMFLTNMTDDGNNFIYRV
jgi:hypothetical protein